MLLRLRRLVHRLAPKRTCLPFLSSPPSPQALGSVTTVKCQQSARQHCSTAASPPRRGTMTSPCCRPAKSSKIRLCGDSPSRTRQRPFGVRQRSQKTPPSEAMQKWSRSTTPERPCSKASFRMSGWCLDPTSSGFPASEIGPTLLFATAASATRSPQSSSATTGAAEFACPENMLELSDFEVPGRSLRSKAGASDSSSRVFDPGAHDRLCMVADGAEDASPCGINLSTRNGISSEETVRSERMKLRTCPACITRSSFMCMAWSSMKSGEELKFVATKPCSEARTRRCVRAMQRRITGSGSQAERSRGW
mmetsp:Transcript_22627/g.40874  ORF Transcript_22627/g.40874 Transcript_22627/m.40874 type:complete len:308 (+) Transcript_22627:77-1000(+)